MEIGMFTMSEIEEFLYYRMSMKLMDAHWNHDFTDCRKLLVNITDKWYVYPQVHTSLYTLAF